MASGDRRDFICLWRDCGKCFHRNSDLRRHYRIHTNERPYCCDVEGCNKSFIQRSALTVHLRTHTGERPFICSYDGCHRAFSDSSSLARHRGVHTNRRAYTCPDPTCKRSFRRKATLRNHQQSSHAQDWAIETLSKAYTAFEQEQKQERFYLPYVPLASLSPQINTYLFCQQGNRYSNDSNITSQTHEFRFQLNLPVSFPAAAASVPVQEQPPYKHHFCAQALSSVEQYAQESYSEPVQQPQQPQQPQQAQQPQESQRRHLQNI